MNNANASGSGLLPNGKYYAVSSKHRTMYQMSGPYIAELEMCGLTPAIGGELRRAAYRCPVNGDGFRYWVQDVVDGNGAYCGSIDRHDLLSEEI